MLILKPCTNYIYDIAFFWFYSRVLLAVTFFYARCYLWTKHTIAFVRNARAALATMDSKDEHKPVAQARRMIYVFVTALVVISLLQVCGSYCLWRILLFTLSQGCTRINFFCAIVFFPPSCDPT